MAKFPDDETEFRLNWTYKAAENAVLSGTANRVREKAGQVFIRRQTATAEALMQLADEIERDANLASKELREYIEEDGRREHDFRTKMKASRPKLKIERGADR